MSNTEYKKTETRADTRELERNVSDQNISVAAVEMLASLKSVQPCKINLQLNDYLDPEALNRLVASSRADLTVSFTVDDYTVTVEGDRTVRCKPN